MKQLRLLSFLLLIFIAGACGKAIPQLDGIDKTQWSLDRNGCSGVRQKMVNTLRDQKNKLLALDELGIVSLLGKPDENELSKRNQKFYHYWITPGPLCGDTTATSRMRLSIRFNAMGLAKEVSVN